jgi:hypothetical protein
LEEPHAKPCFARGVFRCHKKIHLFHNPDPSKMRRCALLCGSLIEVRRQKHETDLSAAPRPAVARPGTLRGATSTAGRSPRARAASWPTSRGRESSPTSG